MSADQDDYYGALVGWQSHELGDRFVLSLESVTTPPPHSAVDVHVHSLVMDRNQAVQLGDYLFRWAGQTAPEKRAPSWLARILRS